MFFAQGKKIFRLRADFKIPYVNVLYFFAVKAYNMRMKQISAVAKNPLYRDRRRRAWELDFMRGVAVIAMCFDHLMYDLASFRGWFSNAGQIKDTFMDKLNVYADGYWHSNFRFWAHYVFVFLFLFMVGISCALSRDNTKRGSKLGALTLLYTFITLCLKEMSIMRYGVIFGILHCIALSILCVEAVNVLTASDENINLYVPLVIGTIILAFGISGKFWDIKWDRVFADDRFAGYILGKYAYGDDWFGLYPYIGCVFLGMYFGKAVYKSKSSLLPKLDGKWNKPFVFIGKHALIMYFIHQIIIAGIVIIVCLCLGYKLSS